MGQIEFYFIASMVFIVIVIALILFRPKNRNKEKEEIKKLNYELVKDIQESSEAYISKIEMKKREMEEVLKQVTSIVEIIVEHDKKIESKNKHKKTQSAPPVPKTIEEHVSDLHRKGYTIEEISNEVNEYKGVVECILNMEKNKSVI